MSSRSDTKPEHLIDAIEADFRSAYNVLEKIEEISASKIVDSTNNSMLTKIFLDFQLSKKAIEDGFISNIEQKRKSFTDALNAQNKFLIQRGCVELDELRSSFFVIICDLKDSFLRDFNFYLKN